MAVNKGSLSPQELKSVLEPIHEILVEINKHLRKIETRLCKLGEIDVDVEIQSDGGSDGNNEPDTQSVFPGGDTPSVPIDPEKLVPKK